MGKLKAKVIEVKHGKRKLHLYIHRGARMMKRTSPTAEIWGGGVAVRFHTENPVFDVPVGSEAFLYMKDGVLRWFEVAGVKVRLIDG